MKVSIRRRTKTKLSWTLNFRVPGEPCPRQETFVGIEEAARKRARQIEQDWDLTGSYQPVRHLRLGAYLDSWLVEQKGRVEIDDLSPTTYTEYERVITNHWKPKFGSRLIGSLGPKEIRSFYSDLELKGYSHNYVKNIHIPVCKALNDAVLDEMISKNPLSSIRIKQHSHRIRKGVLNAEQVSDLLRQVKAHSTYSSQGTPYYLIFYFAFYMGTRISEALALTWARVDLDRQVAEISAGLHWFPGGQYIIRHRVKTGDSDRNIPIPGSLVLKLRAHREWQQARYDEMLLPWSPNELVFSVVDREGKEIRPVRNDTAGDIFKRFAKEIGCPDATLHSTRHSHASILLSNGVPDFHVTKRLGHASASFTQDVYGHLYPNAGQETAAIFDSIMERVG